MTLFGLTSQNPELIILPIPWDVTTSYHDGTAGAPHAILNASSQLDLYHSDAPDFWEKGIAMAPIPKEWETKNKTWRPIAKKIINKIEKEGSLDKHPHLIEEQHQINQISAQLNQWVQDQTLTYLKQGKKVALLGGEHSVSLGYIKALTTMHPHIGVLQIDAHMDLRPAYQGFTYSHASIMHHVLKNKEISHIVQVGIRDYCEEELAVALRETNRVTSITDKTLKESMFKGTSWHALCKKIIEPLPEKVYINVDIDGFDPSLCPSTGTPVPGGLRYDEAIYLINQVTLSGRQVVGFDLVEVGVSSHSDWDANVGARILFNLCAVL